MRNGHIDLNSALEQTTAFQEAMSAMEAEQEQDTSQSVIEHFPCPPILWQGLFAQIGDRLKKRTWEVWLGSLCALGATAHKNIHCQYFRPLYGMVYGLLISPTGTGKGFCTDTCRALLPEFYTVRRSVSSGAGLFPILAEIVRNEKGKVLSIKPRPAILVIEEWTNLLKAAKIEFSNLQDTLNELFHSPFPFNVSRSDSEKSGGDREVENPTLSICATTTESLLKEQVTTKLIRSGFFNRYLVIPGSGEPWDFYNREQAGVSALLVKGYADHLRAHTLGLGCNIWDAYTPEAEARMAAWGRLTFNPIMASRTIEAESIKRLHVYAHIISLLYAWSEQCQRVLPQHVEAAIAAVAVSRTFVESLISDTEVEVPKFKQYEMSLEQKVIAKVKAEPGIAIHKIGQDLRRSGTYRDITETTRRLAREGQINVVKKGRAESFHPSESAQ